MTIDGAAAPPDTEPRPPKASAGGWPPKLSGVAAKVLLLAVFPVLIVAGLSTFISRHNVDFTRRAVENSNSAERNSAALNRDLLAVGEQLLELTQAVNRVVRLHQENLLLPSSLTTDQIRDARYYTMRCIQDFDRQVQSLATALGARGLTGDGANGSPGTDDLDSRLHYLSRWSHSLPRLFQLFEHANDRTTAALQSGDPKTAMANYIYEESSHLNVLDSRVNNMSLVLGQLVERLSSARERQRQSAASSMLETIESTNIHELILIAAATLILLTTAVVYSHYGLSKPLSRMVSAMRSLSSGDKQIDIPGGSGEIGDMSQALAVFRDNAIAREAAEEQLFQAQKMESIGQLTGGVAHDFNNLLCVVLGNLELLQEKLDYDPHLRNLVQRAIGAVDRGTVLVQRLLAFSRKQTLVPKPTDIGAMVLNMTDLLRRTLGAWIEVEADAADQPCIANVDPLQLENVVLNMAFNARDAMPDGGKLKLSARNSFLDEIAAARHDGVAVGEYVLLSATDNGHGIASENLERVFEPFFTTKDVGKGSGLGLSMIYGFVKQSGGHVEIDSVVGHGTEVKIYLPRVTSAG